MSASILHLNQPHMDFMNTPTKNYEHHATSSSSQPHMKIMYKKNNRYQTMHDTTMQYHMASPPCMKFVCALHTSPQRHTTSAHLTTPPCCHHPTIDITVQDQDVTSCTHNPHTVTKQEQDQIYTTRCTPCMASDSQTTNMLCTIKSLCNLHTTKCDNTKAHTYNGLTNYTNLICNNKCIKNFV